MVLQSTARRLIHPAMDHPLSKESLAFHEAEPRGKIAVKTSKPIRTARDLALAYSPGVAGAVEKISEDPENAYRYTSKGNLVAVISNGSAVLGLGNRGALASKPVMEGKAVLFKRFADIDAFDIEIDSADPDEIIRAVSLMEPTFGGINLEDIKAPECFRIEQELVEKMSIPVFHDDQHGTAVVVCAALINALKIAGKNWENVSIVINGAGAAGLAVAAMLRVFGVGKERLLICDSKGVIRTGRKEDVNQYKMPFASDTEKITLADALKDAGIFIGVSKANILTPEMLESMANNPIVFAMANPDPEIDPWLAKSIRPDVIIATGRSDSPNQINNLLCFPFIFRGALDTRSRRINDPMKLAAARAIAAAAEKEVTAGLLEAYGLKTLSFGKDYFLPKPFDTRLLPDVASAVAGAAMESGEAKIKLDLKSYAIDLGRKAEELRGPK